MREVSRVVNDLMASFIGTLVYGTVSDVVERLTGDYIRNRTLWVTSPTGRTTIQLPFYLALRIVRERYWDLTEVEPVRRSCDVS